MELTPNLHAFLWTSTRANNCNTYLIRSAQKNILIDPGHLAFFDHVRSGLGTLGLTVENIDLVICTHAHPDHIEAVQLFDEAPTLFTLHQDEWKLVKEMAPYLQASMNLDLDHLAPDFFLAEGPLTVGDIELEVYHTPGHAPGLVTPALARGRGPVHRRPDFQRRPGAHRPARGQRRPTQGEYPPHGDHRRPVAAFRSRRCDFRCRGRQSQLRPGGADVVCIYLR